MWEPLPGNPDLVLATAAALVARSAQLAGVVDAVDGLTSAQWQTPAGALFAARAPAVPSALSDLARRYGEAGSALRTYAAVLATTQQQCLLAGRRRELALADVVALQREEGSTDDPARRAVLQRRVLEELAEVGAAERAHNAAAGEHARADWKCGERVEALTHDGLTDPATFRTVRYVGQAAGGVGLLGTIPSPVTTPVGIIGGAVVFGTHAWLKVGYGYGSGRQLAGDAAMAALGGAGKALKAGSTVAQVGGRELGLGARLARGLKDSQWTNAAWRISLSSPEPVVGPLARSVTRAAAASAPPVSARARAVARGRLLAAQAVDKRWSTSWEAATRGGVLAQRMLLASWAVEEGGRVARRARTAADARRTKEDVDRRPGSW